MVFRVSHYNYITIVKLSEGIKEFCLPIWEISRVYSHNYGISIVMNVVEYLITPLHARKYITSEWYQAA